MKTLLEVLNLSTEFLKKKGLSHPRREAQDLLSDALGIGRMQIYLEHDRPLSETELEILRSYLQRRIQKEPLAYIHGQVDFHGCRLKVTRDVLIPRQETGILVEKIIEQLEKESQEGKILWDICCGSGCIGLALKKHFPELSISLSDDCPKALAIAKDNGMLNGLHVDYHKGDLWNPFNGLQADYIVCNPPYISERDFANLETDVRDYEPSHALIGGVSGLEYYRRLAEKTHEHLRPGGKMFLEIGDGQGEAVQAFFENLPCKELKIMKDWAGLERFFFLEIV
jgi:release factor glutamine methyltransferase